ncbi:hypothetical protein C8Q74DRAFT_1214216 [Fomes fomentarius]|nr:hypothetical protein C8Q74DRAFT_1214216 [Fomes fomentarius]
MSAAVATAAFDDATKLLSNFVLLSALPLLMGWFIGRQLPSYRLRCLQAALDELDRLYYLCLESGLLTDVTAVDFQGQLVELHAHTNVLRLRISQAVTVYGDLKNLLRGLSMEVSLIHRQVDALRAQISELGYRGLGAQQSAPKSYPPERVYLHNDDSDATAVTSEDDKPSDLDSTNTNLHSAV